MATEHLRQGELPLPTRATREVPVGSTALGGKNPVAVQSMCATRTTDIPATLAQIQLLERAGADIIRVAIDSKKDVEALKQIRQETRANLVVDLQENYRLAKEVAPYIAKFRYNPGHLHHHQSDKSVRDKVNFLVDVAGEFNLAIRIGVNFGSLDPALRREDHDQEQQAIQSALDHCDLMDRFGFQRFVVSLKSSNPLAVVRVNQRFVELRPDVPIHLGVTEAGILPEAEIKSRIAFEQLLARGIGDTIRVSLTLPDSEKDKEITIGRQILRDVAEGKFRSVPKFLDAGLNVISCPSCSRVENKAFVELAYKVKEVTAFAKQHNVTIAVMGCRVNGPGETDEADLGLWCGPKYVNLKRGTETVGAFPYDQVIPRLLQELEQIIASNSATAANI